ncbi:tyrosine-protein phosphatase non-receptor type 20 isoform X10 [Sapajus apella]|uniref:Tyrosine-protein phosphatase non-receptor type 20 isoform X10 n=1 Tax=Sapajus apella TaxID=9515 RepID=A0A6J3GXZ7_SAPAP|nr:tyrosine-protein phosphatase non-receptor type 20 isoform X10 [Sapajus apella]
MSSPRDFRAESVTAILACGQPEAASEETGGAVRMRSVQGPHRLSPLCLLFNIMDIVAQMREQRSGMVQTREQYHFCYSIVLEVLRKLLTLD